VDIMLINNISVDSFDLSGTPEEVRLREIQKVLQTVVGTQSTERHLAEINARLKSCLQNLECLGFYQNPLNIAKIGLSLRVIGYEPSVWVFERIY
jgi:hypothetical protein